MMARKATGQEVLEKAKECLVQAQTVEELRQAQSVFLPLTFGLSLKQTAQAIGVSTGWACQLRRRFLKEGGLGNRRSRGGRQRENLTREQEAEFLAPFLEKAQSGGVLIVTEIKTALENRLERRVALASVYNLLHRHGWRKLSPDKRHRKSDPLVQEDWKKN
jgi:transposase